MSNKINLADYTQYFIPTDDGVLVDTEIFKHRKSLGNKVWDLLKLMCGGGTNKDISAFEHSPDDWYLARKEFDSLRDKFFYELARRDGAMCKECGSMEDLTVDHIIPLSRGGRNDLINMKILCRRDNSRKGAR
ncbi:MAG TPA: HNH endonuclease signature motif containing protein [Anaerolineales bacterium]|nr:HNH endonuclease signature motif containing protein [Anaerolineales bacterium]